MNLKGQPPWQQYQFIYKNCPVAKMVFVGSTPALPNHGHKDKASDESKEFDQ